MKRVGASGIVLLALALLLSSTACAKDTTPPAISAINTSSVSASGVAITWGTDEHSTSQVEYGTTTSYGTSTQLDTNLVTDHSVSVTGLASGTTYHCRVKSRDAHGNEGVSVDQTFETPWVGPNGETLHESVTLEGTIIIGADGHHIALENNPKARDVTWAELRQFLLNDQTNRIPYSDNTFVCADFAERLHNNAEKARIRAAYVNIDFGPFGICAVRDFSTGCPGYCGGGHASNAFQTTDRGLVFVDDTGTDDGSGEDCTVSLVKGQTYTPVSIFSDTEWCPMGRLEDFSIVW